MVTVAVLAACATPSRETGASRHTARMRLPPAEAAACFGRNAEEHSSALVAEVRLASDRANVVVRVKNGVLYATADFRRAGSRSNVTLELNVHTRRMSELVDALLEGC